MEGSPQESNLIDNKMDNPHIKGKFKLQCYKLSKPMTLLGNLLGFIDNRLKTWLVLSFGSQKWDTGFIDNITTNAGKAAIAGLIGNTGAVTAFGYLAVGTSSTAVAATDTTLGAEITDTGLARAASTNSRTTTSVTNDTLSMTYTWTASGSKTVKEIGYFNASSGGTMGGHSLTGDRILTNGDQLVGTYTVQIS